MLIREPIAAGTFYPAQAEACRQELAALFHEFPDQTSAEPVFGGLVPHAGWRCSGRVTAKVFAALSGGARAVTPKRSAGTPNDNEAVIILFGGVHRYRGQRAALFAQGRWQTPLGPIDVNARLAERILDESSLIVDDADAHRDEHSLEVQMPFVKYVLPAATILPIMVPCDDAAVDVGLSVAAALNAAECEVVIIGTTDLTHYGPRYGFTPQGVGTDANDWAKQVNDRRFLDLVCDMKSEQVVPQSVEYRNACSGGAVAATIAAVAALGATRGVLLDHTTSSEVLCSPGDPVAQDSVGYAGVVFN